MIILTLRQPGQPDRRIEVGGDSVLLGRHEKCDVMLTEGYISNHHLRIMSGVVVIDQKSRNGSYLDGQRLDRPALLHKGDVITLGKEQLTLEVESIADGPLGEGTMAQEPAAASPKPAPPTGDTVDQKGPKGLDLLGQLQSLRDQQQEWRGKELSRSQKVAEQVVLLGEQAEALKRKDAEIASLKQRLAKYEGGEG